ncbi:uncharacterized protein [Hetaerina americana]|uniref:uncharacterized protein n=1 Tax=Hetaerina americana TaxID=62018 RepID=UPI003A7F35CD
MGSGSKGNSDNSGMDPGYTSCPYNPSHRILRARFQYHLVKCRRNLRDRAVEEKVICPLDATHHVNKEELAEHMKVCPNRKIVDSERYFMASEVAEPVTSYKLPDIPPCEENWDDPSEPAYTYDPTQHLENQPILRAQHGATRSERRAFRLVERMKMTQFRDGKPMDTEAAATAAGVTIDNGRFSGCGRGQNRLPLGQGKAKKDEKVGRNAANLESIMGAVCQTLPGEVVPLRPPKEQSIALKLAQWSINDNEGKRKSPQPWNSPQQSTGSVSKDKNKKPNNNDGGVNDLVPKSKVHNDDTKNCKIPPAQDWWNHSAMDSSKTKKSTAVLEAYKSKLEESKLAAKMGLSSDKSITDDDRARDFTYLDEEWQIQGRHGKILRAPRMSSSTGAIPKRRNS